MLVQISDQNEATKVYENHEMKNHHGGVIRIGDYLYGLFRRRRLDVHGFGHRREEMA